ncbi:exodeoxyribonuclease VII large subunit [Roseovarius pacificus]|uniref:exodeoxyribonuclease VII large subunit n=1 Tax=Roseovarius pacificus TaxID=337701 RepID=UPI002A186E94|nr:exodeoxyribonuclease VII large subunit [Roseovarius pacificus]
MSDLIDDPMEGENAPEFSVSEISGAVKRVIEGEFAHVRVKGEVGRVSRPRSGHVYLDLKDDRAVLAGVIWKGVATRLSVQPEEGMEVVATGRLTTFPGQSRYQIVIEDIKPAGMGALMAMLEKRKAQLAGEGLFAPERKRPLPFLPEVIGVVTSPSGAVIRDILHRLRDRFPRKVLIWPVAVQGEKCAPEVTRAIEGFNRLTPGGALPRPDLLIVARGGGSIEDLWGFNEESVVRAAAASEIPLISAVGHETDTTLIDFAADQRAPTPTAAAELAVPVRLDLLAWLDNQEARLTHALTSGVTARGQRLRDLARALPRPERLLDGPRQRLDAWSDRLPAALTRTVQTRRVRLYEASGALRPGTLHSRLSGRQDWLKSWGARLDPALLRGVAAKREALDRRADRLTLRPIERDIAQKKEQLGQIGQRFSDAATRQAKGWRDRIDGLDRLRETLGYKATLKRGYAVVRGDGDVVTTRVAASRAEALEIEFSDGRLSLDRDAGDETSGAKPARKAAKPAKPKADPPDQGSLF